MPIPLTTGRFGIGRYHRPLAFGGSPCGGHQSPMSPYWIPPSPLPPPGSLPIRTAKLCAAMGLGLEGCPSICLSLLLHLFPVPLCCGLIIYCQGLPWSSVSPSRFPSPCPLGDPTTPVVPLCGDPTTPPRVWYPTGSRSLSYPLWDRIMTP